MRSVPTKITGNTYTATEFNELMSQELQNSVLTSGQTLSASDLDQLGKAMSIYGSAGDFYTDGGSANTYVLTPIGVPARQAPPSYIDGLRVRFVAGNDNTGASTINLNSLGVKSLKENGSDVSASRIIANSVIEAVFISSLDQFELVKVSDHLTIRMFGASPTFTDVVNNAAITLAIAATPEGGTLWVPADGTYLFTNLLIDRPITIKGEGWHMDQNSTPFGAAKWLTDPKGSILRSTSTVSTAIIIGKPNIITLQYPFKDIAIVGPGTGTSAGFVLGNSATNSGSLSTIWTNVLIGNFSIPIKADNIEQCLFTRVVHRGCNIGIDIINTACNANSWRDCEWQACDVAAVKFSVAGGGNTFDGGLSQGNGADGFILTGIKNRIHNIWMEQLNATGFDVKLLNGSIDCEVIGNNNLKNGIKIEGAATQRNVIKHNAANAATSTVITIDAAVTLPNYLEFNTEFTVTDNGGKAVILDFDSQTLLSKTRPAFNVFDTVGALNVTGFGTIHPVVFNSEKFDQSGDFNNTTGVFTAPTKGLYRFSATVQLIGIVAATDIRMEVKTTIRSYKVWGRQYSTQNQTEIVMNGTVLADMNVGDTAIIEVFAGGEAGDIIDIAGGGDGRTCFHGELVM